MLGRLGGPEILVIAAIAILIFGPKKLPQLGKALGDTVRELRGAAKALHEDDSDEEK